MKIISFLRLLKDLFRHRNMLIQKFNAIKKEENYKNIFLNKFGYFPVGLRYENIDMLELGENAHIGDNNKIIYSKTKFPTSSKPTKIFLGKNVWTGTGVELNVLTGSQIIIRAHSSIQDKCKLIGDVTVERYCIFAPSIFISSGNHYAVQNEATLIRNQDSKHIQNEELLQLHSKKVHIEEDCWIGIGTFIRQGIYIGRGSVIGANACITKNVLPYSIVVGNNKVINSRITFNPPMQIDASNKEHLPYFYRGFMQKEDEMVDTNSFSLYEEESIIVLQKTVCNHFKINGRVIGNLNIGLLTITINNTSLFEFNITENNFEIVCDITKSTNISTNQNKFLSEICNTISLKINGYKFSKKNHISITSISQST